MKQATVNRINFMGVGTAMSGVAILLAAKVPADWLFLVAGFSPIAGMLFLIECMKRDWFGMGVTRGELEVEITTSDGATQRMTASECIDKLHDHNKELMRRIEMLRAASKALSIAAYQQGYDEGAEDGERGMFQPERRAQEFAEGALPPATKVH